ncbi:FAD-dependent oxidoreductase [Mycolicibacterium sp. 120266]|uniref:FAD-dependent oxidoreductase n=1 Tax=Mycolicibacterium sp. 120266 TaxID=3090601 RepID=UPI00299E26BE|nr:FAD-dependent oxidoreductase [Mycolicibacterium sp. 120266]MDX1875096.1 FAD-dependent oxidoreductase [Mycolicibacterium sp. 120266]
MAFVITQNCCTDASCVPVCPVDCIRPVPGPTGAAAPMLYIDPGTCVDCGACVAVCPVGAIYHEDDVPAAQQRFTEINAAYFAAEPLSIRPAPAKWSPGAVGRDALRVAVVGAGPAACYAVADLARTSGVQVDVFDRLPTPFGLVRFGVAPDHQRTKDVTQVFETALAAPNVNCFFNVVVGQDISHDELTATHDAVIYAVGASQARELGIPGEELAGTAPAAAFVNWYNGHPDYAGQRFDLTGPRVVVIGNGNVALDVARVLVSDRDRLATTDIAAHALDQLAAGSVREVVVVGRRGAADGAFSVGELLALGTLPGVDVTVEGELGERPDDHEGAVKFDLVREYAQRPPTPGNKRIVLRFGARPVRLEGDAHVSAVALQDNCGVHSIDTSLVLTSIGYRGTPVPGLPFDEVAGIVPHDGGRVLRDGMVQPGVYVTGWIKRGPRGVIGTNRLCARETVTNLLADARAGVLPKPTSHQHLDATLAERGVEVVTLAGWHLIDAVEREKGSATSRPRVKVVDRRAMLTAAGVSR